MNYFRNYQRDGPMTVSNNQAGAPNYYPNSFSGPQVMLFKYEFELEYFCRIDVVQNRQFVLQNSHLVTAVIVADDSILRDDSKLRASILQKYSNSSNFCCIYCNVYYKFYNYNNKRIMRKFRSFHNKTLNKWKTADPH